MLLSNGVKCELHRKLMHCLIVSTEPLVRLMLSLLDNYLVVFLNLSILLYIAISVCVFSFKFTEPFN